MSYATCPKAMRFETFMEDLRAAAEYFVWDDPQSGTMYVRGRHKNGKTYCPLTAVTYVTLGLDYRADAWVSAAFALGLPLAVAKEIAEAADAGVLHNTECAEMYEMLQGAA
jgi:hypothetical protein